MTTATLPDFLTRDQAAEFLNLRRQTLAAWACQGRGPRFAKFGKAVRYRRADLEKYVEENLVSSDGEDEDEA